MPRFGRSFPLRQLQHERTIRNTIVPAQPQGQPQALVGTIACQLQFDYASGATPNDTSPLTVAHTLQGPITCQLIFSPNSGGVLNDSSNLTVAHTLAGSITLQLIYTYTSGGQLIDQCSLNVAHTATSNIVTQVNITGGSNLAITTQSSVACLAVLSAQLAVAHPLQGSITDQLIFTYTSGGQLIDQVSLTVAHNLISTIALNSSITGGSNLNESSQTGITDVNVFSGQLNVFHPLAGPIITILGFSDSFAVAHTLDNGGINGSTGLTDSFFTVFHTLQGTIAINLGMSGTAGGGGGGGGVILISGGVSGSLNVFHPLQGETDQVLVMSGGSNIAITGAGSITNIGTIIENVNVAHPLPGEDDNVLTITSSDLPVFHTLQGAITCNCKLDQSGIILDEEQIGSLNVAHNLIGQINGSLGMAGNVTAGANGPIIIVGSFTGNLGVFHPLQGEIDGVLVMSGGSNIAITGTGTPLLTLTITENLNVAHNLIGEIDGSLGVSGTAGSAGTGGGTVIIAGSFTGNLGVFHPLQGETDSVLTMSGGSNVAITGSGTPILSLTIVENLNVAHTLVGEIDGSLGFSGLVNAGNTGTITIAGSFTGSLNVFHPLQGEEDNISNLIGNENTGHTLDNQGITLISLITVTDLKVAHTLQGSITDILSGGTFLSTGQNGNIALVSIITGSLTNAVALQGSIVDSLIITVPVNLNLQYISIIPAGCTIIGSLNVAITLQGLIPINSTLGALIFAGAHTFAFPGDLVIGTQINNFLIAPSRNVLLSMRKRFNWLFVPPNPRKSR